MGGVVMDFCFILSCLLLFVLAIVFLVLMTITVGKFILEQLSARHLMTVVVGDEMFPKNYICAYKLNNEYNDYEIGDFLYFGNGEFNGENKDYPIYAWMDKPTVIPEPPKD